MQASDLEALRQAKQLLENPGLAIQIANYIGKPVEWAIAKLPERAGGIIVSATKSAMESALEAAVWTLAEGAQKPKDWRHRLAVIATGMGGGFFGLAGLPVELPISTTIMLRSVADNARAQGEDLGKPDAKLNCLLVFALGGSSNTDDAAEVGYFAVRTALAKAVAEAGEYMAGRVAADVVADKGAPAFARLIAGIASRFEPQIAEKIAGQAAPFVGAAAGAVINTLFINHFQNMARGHFTVRRLERKYGADVVRETYDKP